MASDHGCAAFDLIDQRFSITALIAFKIVDRRRSILISLRGAAVTGPAVRATRSAAARLRSRVTIAKAWSPGSAIREHNTSPQDQPLATGPSFNGSTHAPRAKNLQVSRQKSPSRSGD
jgi:hypothetical protein